MTSYPKYFPFNLATDSGYFPEIFQNYGKLSIQLNITFPTLPYVKSIFGLGIQGNISPQVDVRVQKTGEVISVFSVTFKLQYMINLYIDESYVLRGYPLRPSVLSIDLINSNIGPINQYYLNRLILDIFQLTANKNSGIFFSPLRLPYTYGTSFPKFFTRYYEGYIEVDYETTFSNNVY